MDLPSWDNNKQPSSGSASSTQSATTQKLDLENWKSKLNEIGFIHPPLHKFIENLLSLQKEHDARGTAKEIIEMIEEETKRTGYMPAGMGYLKAIIKSKYGIGE